MSKSQQYQLTGYVRRLQGPYELAGHEGRMLCFDLVAERKDGVFPYYNCVFYLDLAHPDVTTLMGRICRSMVDPRELVTVHFDGPPAWNGQNDPSYIIADVT